MTRQTDAYVEHLFDGAIKKRICPQTKGTFMPLPTLVPNGGTKGGVDYASQGLAAIVESLLSGLFRSHNSWEEAALEQPTNDWQMITIQLQIPLCHMRNSKQMHGQTPTAARTVLKVSSGSKMV
ncbi:uncharacterized [Tachysurus ichikawai]